MNKPIKPEITIPQSFAENGVKTDFDDTLLTDGFDSLRPDVLAGDNLNKFIDDTYKGLNYGMAAADALNLINEGETLTVVNGEFTSGAAGGGGLEIGDIGIAPLGIDETKGKRRYLNGQVIIQDQYVQFTNKVKSAVALYPSLACTESEWQTTATMTVGGQVGKFVVDNEAGTIRLPKIIMPIQGLTDLSKLAEIVKAGLPNITTGIIVGHNGITSDLAVGALKFGQSTIRHGTYNAVNTNNDQNLSFDASKANPIYGNSNTVQQEQIQYPYFIQVATGAETEDNIINEIELNNPFSLLDYKYSEYELNNISWLRSNGQYNSKAIYPAVYDLLLKIYNGIETKAGVSVKLSTEEYTDYDFVLNTAEEAFRLPIITTNRVLIAKKEATSNDDRWFNLYSDGWYEEGGTYTGSTTSVQYVSFLNQFKEKPTLLRGYEIVGGSSAAWSEVGYKNLTVQGFEFSQNTGVYKNSSWRACGYVATTNSINYLYFYVGETVQNANLINAGRIEEKLTDCVTRSSLVEIPVVIETYQNGTSWYRVWSDGWCEQGGRVSVSTDSNVTVTFLKPFANTDYYANWISCSGVAATGAGTRGADTLTTTSMRIYNGQDVAMTANWQACGYIW